MRKLALLILLFTLIGCKTRTVYVPLETVTTKTETEMVRDTIVNIKLIPYFEEIVTEKDSSYLKNEYSYSKAWWDGSKLHHTLGIFNKIIPTNIQYKDKYVYITETKRESYPVEKQATLIDKILTTCGWIFIAQIFGFLVFLLLKLIK